jgi:hypothetical protein
MSPVRPHLGGRPAAPGPARTRLRALVAGRTVDSMTEPEFSDRDESLVDPTLLDLETPPEDALEQAVPQNPADQADEVHTGDDVNEYDALEQSRTVDLDDDYR